MATKREMVIVIWRFGYESPDTVQTLRFRGNEVRVYEKDRIDPRAYLGETMPPYFDDVELALEHVTKNPNRVAQLNLEEAKRNGLV
jgi:hypothetical protein